MALRVGATSGLPQSATVVRPLTGEQADTYEARGRAARPVISSV